MSKALDMFDARLASARHFREVLELALEVARDFPELHIHDVGLLHATWATEDAGSVLAAPGGTLTVCEETEPRVSAPGVRAAVWLTSTYFDSRQLAIRIAARKRPDRRPVWVPISADDPVSLRREVAQAFAAARGA